MSRKSRVRVFFDASCLVAAAGSPQGGAGYTLSNCVGTPLSAVTNSAAWEEAERNVRLKMKSIALERLQVLKEFGIIEFVEENEEIEDHEAPSGVNENDQPIVRGALVGECIHILSLARALIKDVNQLGLNMRAWLPGDFIKDVMRPLLKLDSDA